jgi:hypothetical protein
VTILKTATTVTAAVVPPLPPPVEEISSKTVSITDACEYARRVAEFLEELKNKENDREGNPFYLLIVLTIWLLSLTYTSLSHNFISTTGGNAESTI